MRASARKKILVSQCRPSHTFDKNRKPTRGYERQPIDVEWSSWHGRYVVIDGTARLHAAIQRGDAWIDATVWN